VAITPASAASSAANFFRSVIQWLQVGYPEGVPGPDRVALLALLRSTPLTEDEITEVVDAIDEERDHEPVDRDVIADFISDMTHYDASPENISRVAARLAAAGWPLSGITPEDMQASASKASPSSNS
jgi:anthranilate phosphoribosyltransferase